MKKKDPEPVWFGDKVLGNSILGPFIYDFPIPKGKQVEVLELKFIIINRCFVETEPENKKCMQKDLEDLFTN